MTSYNSPVGNHMCISSPTILPNPAPILNTGMKLPLGTGIVELMIENMNWKSIDCYNWYLKFMRHTNVETIINSTKKLSLNWGFGVGNQFFRQFCWSLLIVKDTSCWSGVFTFQVKGLF